MSRSREQSERLSDLINIMESINKNAIWDLCENLGLKTIDDLERYIIPNEDKSHKNNEIRENFLPINSLVSPSLIKILKQIFYFKENKDNIPYKEIEKIEFGVLNYKRTICREYEYQTSNSVKKDNYPVKIPTINVLKKISHFFGVNANWLIKGEGKPFYNHDLNIYRPGDLLEHIPKLSPKKYYFILSDNPEKEVAIILQLSNYKFIVLPKVWHMNPDCIGRSGQRQLESLCFLLETLFRKSGLEVEGKLVENQLFQKLVSGKIYPGIISYKASDHNVINSYWHDDITDINHHYSIADKYKNYGDWFVNAQKTIVFIRDEKLSYHK